jgi:hypothetical protein
MYFSRRGPGRAQTAAAQGLSLLQHRESGKEDPHTPHTAGKYGTPQMTS